MVFGGYDGTGNRLSDLRMFDMSTNKWALPIPPLSGPPDARSYGGLTVKSPTAPVGVGNLPVPSNTMVLMGGSGGFDSLGDIWELRFPACPLIPAAGIDPLNSRFYYGGSVWWPVCYNGFIAANPVGTPLICGPKGLWIGSAPPCVLPPPAAPTSPSATGLAAPRDDVGVVSVSWAASSATTGLAPVDYYVVGRGSGRLICVIVDEDVKCLV